MNVSDRGIQPFMRDTVWDGKPQKDGRNSKGLKTLLEERKVKTDGLLKEDMIKIVEQLYFKEQSRGINTKQRSQVNVYTEISL